MTTDKRLHQMIADESPSEQVLLDESLALEVAQEWAEGRHGLHNKIAIRNFHFLRQAAENAQAYTFLNGMSHQNVTSECQPKHFKSL